jgi:hypothetical protein
LAAIGCLPPVIAREDFQMTTLPRMQVHHLRASLYKQLCVHSKTGLIQIEHFIISKQEKKTKRFEECRTIPQRSSTG